MNLGDIFKEFKLDTWYKVLMVVGIVGFVTALTVDVKAITNSQLALLSGGMFLLGLGVWKGQRFDTHILQPNIHFGGNAIQVTQARYEPEFVSCSFLIIGLIVLGVFVFSLLSSGSAMPPTSVPTATDTLTATPQTQATVSVSATP